MTHNIADLEGKFVRVRASWGSGGVDRNHDKLQELKSMLDELWRMDGTEAVDLRRRIRTFIDEAEHVVRHEQIRKATWRPPRR